MGQVKEFEYLTKELIQKCKDKDQIYALELNEIAWQLKEIRRILDGRLR